MDDYTTSYIENINGIDIYYETYLNPQTNKTIFLLHGFLSSSFCYRKLIPLLRKDYNVLSIDLPPFGKSGKSNHYHYSYENIALTILALLDRLGYKHIYALGHSMGGQIVLNMMRQRPAFIKKAILLCSSAYLPRAKSSLIVLSYLPFIDKFIKHHLSKTGVLGNLKLVVHNESIIDQEMINGYSEPFNHNGIFRGLAKMLRHREGDLSSTSLHTLQTPCLLIWGENDRVVPLETGKRLTNDLPNSKLVILQETGHLLPEERPEMVYNEIKHFIS